VERRADELTTSRSILWRPSRPEAAETAVAAGPLRFLASRAATSNAMEHLIEHTATWVDADTVAKTASDPSAIATEHW
jgi:hypothetical protein